MELNTRFNCPLMETNLFELKKFIRECNVSCSHCLLLLDMHSTYDMRETYLSKNWRIDFVSFFEQKGLII